MTSIPELVNKRIQFLISETICGIGSETKSSISCNDSSILLQLRSTKSMTLNYRCYRHSGCVFYTSRRRQCKRKGFPWSTSVYLNNSFGRQFNHPNQIEMRDLSVKIGARWSNYERVRDISPKEFYSTMQILSLTFALSVRSWQVDSRMKRGRF